MFVCIILMDDCISCMNLRCEFTDELRIDFVCVDLNSDIQFKD